MGCRCMVALLVFPAGGWFKTKNPTPGRAVGWSIVSMNQNPAAALCASALVISRLMILNMLII